MCVCVIVRYAYYIDNEKEEERERGKRGMTCSSLVALRMLCGEVRKSVKTTFASFRTG